MKKLIKCTETREKYVSWEIEKGLNMANDPVLSAGLSTEEACSQFCIPTQLLDQTAKGKCTKCKTPGLFGRKRAANCYLEQYMEKRTSVDPFCKNN